MLKRFIKPPYSILRATLIDLDRCRLPTASVLSNKAEKLCSKSVLIIKSKFLKATHRTEIRKIEIPRSMVVEALSWWNRRANQHPSIQSPVHPYKSPTNLGRSPLLVDPRRKKKNRGQTSAFPQKPPGSRLRFSLTGVQHSSGLSTIELLSAFAESGAYPPDRALPGSPRQWFLPLACRQTSRRAPNWRSEEACTWEHHSQPTKPPSRLSRQDESREQPDGCIARGWAQPYTRLTLPHSCPEIRFWRERTRVPHAKLLLWKTSSGDRSLPGAVFVSLASASSPVALPAASPRASPAASPRRSERPPPPPPPRQKKRKKKNQIKLTGIAAAEPLMSRSATDLR